MDDLERDLATLLRDRADQTDVPHLPLDDVLARGQVAASQSRRRGGVVAIIAAAAVIAVIAIPVGIQSLRSSSGPTGPSTPPPSSQYEVLSFIHSLSGPSDVAIAPDGRYLTLWSRCGQGTGGEPCQVAWMMQSGVAAEPTPGTAPTASTTTTTSVGWAPSDAHASVSGVSLVVTSYASDDGFVINDDGTTTALRALKATTPTPTQIASGSVVEHNGGLRLVDPEAHTWMPVLDDLGSALSTGVTDGSTLWAERKVGGHVDVERSSDSGAWERHILPGGSAATPGAITATHGQAVATDDVLGTGVSRVAGISVTHDNGGTWTDIARGASLPITDITGMAAANGTLFVSSSSGMLYESADSSWTTFGSLSNPSAVRVLQATYDDVLFLQLDHGVPIRLGVIADDGSWQNFGPPFVDLAPPLPSQSASADATLAAVSDMPAGALPKVPYIRGDQVVINGIPNNAPAHYSIVSAGGVVIVGDDWSNHRGTFWVFRGFGWVRAPWLGGTPPVLDSNGRYAAVLSYPDAATTRITEVDPTTGHVFGHLDLDAPHADGGSGSRNLVAGIDDYGNVYFLDYVDGSLMRWAPHKVPAKLGGVADYAAVNALGVVMTHATEPGVLYLVRADTGARQIASSTVGGVWSGDGHRLFTGTTVIDVETGEQFPLTLPDQLAITPLGFENDDTVELVVHNAGAVYPADHPASILRCFVETGKCERAEDLPNLQKTQFPPSF